MATNTSNSLSFVLDEVVSAVAFESFFEEQFMMPALFSVRQSGRRRERLASIGGLSEFTTKEPMAQADTDAVVQQFEKDFVHDAYAKTVPVERELIDDEEFGVVADLGDQLGVMGAYTIENKAAGIFRDAFAGATHKAEDGLSLCNTAHLNSDGGNSQGNSGTTALSMSSVKATRTLMRKFTNYNGELMSVRPNLLICPSDLEEDAWEIVRSSGRPDSANLASNFYNGMFDLAIWDFLGDGVDGGDNNNWFMADSRMMSRNLLWYQRIALETYGDGDLFSGTRRLGAYMRFSYGSRDWRYIYGHNVA